LEIDTVLRFTVLAAIALAALAPARASAQPVLPGPFRVVEAKADGGKVIWSEIKFVPQVKEEERVVVINGMNVTQKVAVTVFVPVQETIGFELKKLKATDGTGKAIAADKLAELLKESTPVVIVSGPVPEKHRALFKEKTVFLELPQPEPGKGPEPVPPPKM
jgi:hypothetical protein